MTNLAGIETWPDAADIVRSIGGLAPAAAPSPLEQYVRTITALRDTHALDGLRYADGGHIDAYAQFCRDYRFVPIVVNRAIAHPVLRYTGVIDRIGRFGSHGTIPHHQQVLISFAPTWMPAGFDYGALVTALHAAWMCRNVPGVQCAPYIGGDPDWTDVHANRCFSLRLRQDGTYQLVRHHPDEWRAFAAALALYDRRAAPALIAGGQSGPRPLPARPWSVGIGGGLDILPDEMEAYAYSVQKFGPFQPGPDAQVLREWARIIRDAMAAP